MNLLEKYPLNSYKYLILINDSDNSVVSLARVTQLIIHHPVSSPLRPHTALKLLFGQNEVKPNVGKKCNVLTSTAKQECLCLVCVITLKIWQHINLSGLKKLTPFSLCECDSDSHRVLSYQRGTNGLKQSCVASD